MRIKYERMKEMICCSERKARNFPNAINTHFITIITSL